MKHLVSCWVMVLVALVAVVGSASGAAFSRGGGGLFGGGGGGSGLFGGSGFFGNGLSRTSGFRGGGMGSYDEGPALQPVYDPVPDVPSPPQVSTIHVRIVNPEATNFTLSYSVAGQSYTLASGNVQELDVPSGSSVEFGRGNDHGTATYTLSAGTYTFASTNHGWELYQGDAPSPSVPVTIVNPAETNFTLTYTIDGRDYQLESGKNQQIMVYPDSVIEFGRGGDFPRAKYSLSSGAYTFASTSHGWELYHR